MYVGEVIAPQGINLRINLNEFLMIIIINYVR